MLIAIISGALMSIQGVFNTQVTKAAGIWVGNAWVQISAFVCCVLLWFINGRDRVTALFETTPSYSLLGGVIGAGITWTVIKSIEAVGPAKASFFIVLTQLSVSYLIEIMGMFGVDKQPLEWKKVLGLGIALAGIGVFSSNSI